MEYLLSEVNVAPIRFGSGTQNKIIEVLALGVPTVASTITVESFDEELKNIIFQANTPEEYAKAIDKIFPGHEIRTKFMEDCKIKIRTILSWNGIISDEMSYLKTLIKKSLQ